MENMEEMYKRYGNLKSKIFIYNDYKISRTIPDNFDNLKSDLKTYLYLDETQNNNMHILDVEKKTELNNNNFNELMNNNECFLVEIRDKEQKKKLIEIRADIQELRTKIMPKTKESLNLAQVNDFIEKTIDPNLKKILNNIEKLISSVPSGKENLSISSQNFLNSGNEENKFKMKEKNKESTKFLGDTRGIKKRSICSFKNEKYKKPAAIDKSSSQLKTLLWTDVVFDSSIRENEIPKEFSIHLYDENEKEIIEPITEKTIGIKPGQTKNIKTNIFFPKNYPFKEENIFKVYLSYNREIICEKELTFQISCNKQILSFSQSIRNSNRSEIHNSGDDSENNIINNIDISKMSNYSC